ncbi:Alkaline phosphatase synthesis sensor protein PhoR [compost metagenome]
MNAREAFLGFEPQAPDAVSEFAARAQRLLGAESATFWRMAGTTLHLEEAWGVSAAEAMAALMGLGQRDDAPQAFPDAGGALLYLPLIAQRQCLGAFLFRVSAMPEGAWHLPLALPAAALALAFSHERLAFREAALGARFERMIDALHLPMIFLDAALRPVSFNKAYRDLHDLAEHETFDSLRALWARISHRYLDPAAVQRLFGAWPHAPLSPPSVEVEFREPREGYYRLVLTPFVDGQGAFAGAVASFYDVTQERRLMRLQADFIESLEERVNERTHELRHANQALTLANQQLRELDRMKSDFISTVSHELRTPLNLIVGFASLLDEGVSGDLNPDHREWVRGVIMGSMRLKGLIDNILDLSRLAAGRFELHCAWVEPRAMLLQAVEELQVHPDAQGKRITLDLPPDLPTLWASPETLYQQVLMNLAVNALKFTEPGGEIRFAAWVEGGKFALEVTDTGIGIPQEAFGKIFDRFVQVDSSSTRRHGGSGLGLAIAREIVELHGGTIEVKSELGVGSRFCVRLPLAAPGHDAGEGAPCTS